MATAFGGVVLCIEPFPRGTATVAASDVQAHRIRITTGQDVPNRTRNVPKLRETLSEVRPPQPQRTSSSRIPTACAAAAHRELPDLREIKRRRIGIREGALVDERRRIHFHTPIRFKFRFRFELEFE